MKISKVRLENIKCFQKIDLSLKEGWNLIIGNNGDGKTTLLMSIALGFCDKTNASGLLAELYDGILRDDEKEGLIEIELKDEEGKTYRIKNTILGGNGTETLTQEVFKVNDKGEERPEEEFPSDIFAVAYGSSNRTEGTRSYPGYATVDSVYGLFNPEHKLQNPELAARRLEGEERKKLFGKLQEILMLSDEDKIFLEKNGLFSITEKWGERPLQSLSDGFKALTTIVLDFISWAQLNDKAPLSDDLSGIFIIDEIEQHLHPSWQRGIIQRLAKAFRKVQFIASTHSPICAVSLSDMNDSQLLKASYADGHSEIHPRRISKRDGVDQILTSTLFDLSDTRSENTEADLDKYAELYLKEELSEEDESEKRELEKRLSELLRQGPYKKDIAIKKLEEKSKEQHKTK